MRIEWCPRGRRSTLDGRAVRLNSSSLNSRVGRRDQALLQCGEIGRRENRIAERGDYGAGFLALVAYRDPFRVRLKRREFLLALVQRFPFENVIEVRVRFADRHRPEANWLDAVLLEQLNGGRFETRYHGGQLARHAMINSQFVQHRNLRIPAAV